MNTRSQIPTPYRNGFDRLATNGTAYIQYGGPAQVKGYVLTVKDVADRYSEEYAEAQEQIFVFRRPEYVPPGFRIIKDWYDQRTNKSIVREAYEPCRLGHSLKDREIIGVLSDKFGRVIGKVGEVANA